MYIIQTRLIIQEGIDDDLGLGFVQKDICPKERGLFERGTLLPVRCGAKYAGQHVYDQGNKYWCDVIVFTRGHHPYAVRGEKMDTSLLR